MIYRYITKYIKHIFILLLLGFFYPLHANNTTYTIRTIKVIGNTIVSSETITSLCGIEIGKTINHSSPVLYEGIRKIAKHDFIKTVAIYFTDLDQDKAKASIVIQVEEYPKLNTYLIEGLSKEEKNELLKDVPLPCYAALSPYFIKTQTRQIEQYFIKKGFKHAKVSMELVPHKEHTNDTLLKIQIHKGTKYVVNTITFEGNDHIEDKLLIYKMKTLKEAAHLTLFKDIFKKVITLKPIRKGGILLNPPKKLDDVMYYLAKHVSFGSSVFTDEKYTEAKNNLILFYQSKGFRDMAILEEKITYPIPGKVHIHLKIKEGQQYFIRNITWTGNHLYSSKKLQNLLNLPKGKVYDPLYLQNCLKNNIATLYMNHGYLFFQAEAIETGIEGNQIDLEIRVFEGEQMTINQVNIKGNTMTHDYVIRRELKTLPGDKFSYQHVMESMRNLMQSQLFKSIEEPEIIPNPSNNTVDITYHIKEKPDHQFNLRSDQLFKSISLDLGSNNISLKNLFTGKSPLGAAQQLFLTYTLQKNLFKTSNGDSLNSFSISFKEPWFWLNQKRYILSLDFSYTHQNIKQNTLSITDSFFNTTLFPYASLDKPISTLSWIGGGIYLGKKISKHGEGHMGFSYTYNTYNNYELLQDYKRRYGINHDISFKFSYIHSTINHPNFPTKGCLWNNFLTITPPYSLFGYKPSTQSPLPKFKEFCKYMVDIAYYKKIVNKFVFHARFHAGFLFKLSNSSIDIYERFHLGGTSPQETQRLLNPEFIGLRGYPIDSITPKDDQKNITGGCLYNKFVAELRYPLMLSPAILYVLGFFEAGDNWLKYKYYDLRTLKKSIGACICIILPVTMIPQINLGIGYRLDPVYNIYDKNNAFEYIVSFNAMTR